MSKCEVKENVTVNKKFDAEKFKSFIYERKLTSAEVSRRLGFGSGYISNISSRGTAPNYFLKALAREFDVSEDYFAIVEPVQEVCEEVTNEEVTNETTNYKEIISKLDELNMTINKLGNIQMQTMEYLKATLDEIKELNKKWN